MIRTFTGPNSFLLNVELKNVVSVFINEYGDFAIEQIDGEEADYQTVYDSISNLPFLSVKKLVILKRPSANKQFISSFDEIIKNIPETIDLVLLEPELDKRSSYYKSLKKLTDYHEFNNLEGNDLVKWVIDLTKSKHASIDNSTARYLIEMAGSNQTKLFNEINKLIAYNSSISRESIDTLIEPSPQTTIFQLLDSAFAGRHRATIQIYDDQRKQKVEPAQIIAMLAWQLHIVAMIKTAGKVPIAEIAQKSRVNPFVLSKSASVANKLSLTELRLLISRVVDLDASIKTKTIDADDALKQLLLSIGS